MARHGTVWRGVARQAGGPLMSTEDSKRRLFSRKDAGIYLDKSLSEIDRLIASGVLCAKKDGRRTVIDRRELDRYADRLPTIEPRAS